MKVKKVVFLSLIKLPLSQVPRSFVSYANRTTTLFSFFSQIESSQGWQKECGLFRILSYNSDFTSFNPCNWENYSTSPSYSFLFYKTGIIIIIPSGVVTGLETQLYKASGTVPDIYST